MARKTETVVRLSNTDRELLRSIAGYLERIADEVAPERNAVVTPLVPLVEDKPVVWEVPAGAGLGYEFGEQGVEVLPVPNTLSAPPVIWRGYGSAGIVLPGNAPAWTEMKTNSSTNPKPVHRADEVPASDPEKNLHEFGPEDLG